MHLLRFALLACVLVSSAAAQSPRLILLLKADVHRQSAETPTLLGYGAFASVEFAQPYSGSVSLRTPSATKTLTRDSTNTFFLAEPFFSRAALDAQYPAGNYTLQLGGVSNASYPLTIGAAPPNPPAIANFAAAQAIANPGNFTLSWNAFEGAGELDFIGLSIESTDGQFSYEMPGDFILGTTTQVQLDLPPNKSFTGEIVFIRTSQFPSTSGGPLIYAGWGSMTQFTLRTLDVGNVTPPAIAAQPLARTAAVGSTTSFTINATGGGTLAYQWRLNGTPITGATTNTLTLPSVQAFQAGSYSVVVSNSAGSVTSAAATLTTTPTSTAGSNARLANLSTRGLAGAGGESLIPGFVITGNGTKRLLIRGIGPALAQFGIPATELVADPTVTLIAAATGATVATNDDWNSSADAAAIATAATNAGAFALPPGSRDAALLVTLPPGAYTAVVSGKTVAPGVAIVEVYDLDAPGSGTRLVNIATRGLVGTGTQILIPGFVVGGTAPKTYVIRGLGPALAQPPFGVSGTLADPVLSVYQGNALLFSNDDWSNNTTAGELVLASQRAGAFELASGSRDAALLVTLQPGAYTFQLAGKGTSTGVGLVEVYEVP